MINVEEPKLEIEQVKMLGLLDGLDFISETSQGHIFVNWWKEGF